MQAIESQAPLRGVEFPTRYRGAELISSRPGKVVATLLIQGKKVVIVRETVGAVRKAIDDLRIEP